MNLIARLFRNRPNLSQPTEIPTAWTPTVKEEGIPADLFIDDNPPASGHTLPVVKNIVNDFLSHEYCTIGSREGVNYHCNEPMEARKKELNLIVKTIEVK